MEELFDSVYKFLKWISVSTGFTYREVNIIVYFIIIPSFLLFLISKIYKKKYIIISFVTLVSVVLILIPDFEVFSDRLFDLSVVFLKWFENLGLNYVQASVVICVFMPLLIILLLIYLKKKNS